MFEEINKILVDEMQIDPSDITPEAELVNDLGIIPLSLPTWFFSAKSALASR